MSVIEIDLGIQILYGYRWNRSIVIDKGQMILVNVNPDVLLSGIFLVLCEAISYAKSAPEVQ